MVADRLQNAIEFLKLCHYQESILLSVKFVRETVGALLFGPNPDVTQ
jgi:hypothetical protein